MPTQITTLLTKKTISVRFNNLQQTTLIRVVTDFEIRVWARPDFISALANVTDTVRKSIKILEEFWGCAYPLPKIDLLALPNYQATRPADNWGLLLFK